VGHLDQQRARLLALGRRQLHLALLVGQQLRLQLDPGVADAHVAHQQVLVVHLAGGRAGGLAGGRAVGRGAPGGAAGKGRRPRRLPSSPRRWRAVPPHLDVDRLVSRDLVEGEQLVPTWVAAAICAPP
jgi:hypothetical protein